MKLKAFLIPTIEYHDCYIEILQAFDKVTPLPLTNYLLPYQVK